MSCTEEFEICNDLSNIIHLSIYVMLIYEIRGLNGIVRVWSAQYLLDTPMLSKSSFCGRTPEQKIFIYSNCNIYFNSVKFLVLVNCCCIDDFPRPSVYTVCQNYIWGR